MPAPYPCVPESAEMGKASAFWGEASLGILGLLAMVSWIALCPASAASCGRELNHGVIMPLLFSAAAATTLGLRRLRLAAFVVVAGAFVLQLWWRWFSGTSDTMLVGGLLPFSDASDYLANAQRLAGGARFLGDANNRPLATAMLAVLWELTQGDYRLVLLLIALLGAAGAWICTAEISLLFGAGGAAAWLFVDILFLRRFVGVPLTEHLGVLLGSLAVALGCRAVRTGQESNWIWSGFALALALCARAGPMFVLPAFLAGAFLAWPNRKTGRWVLPGYIAAAMAGALALNRIVSESVGLRDYMTNAVYILHGIVFGGTWKGAMSQYGNDRHAVWHAVEIQLLSHPLSLFTGGARSLLGFARQFYLFSFAGRRWLNAVLHLAFAAGGISALLMLRRDARAWWLLAPRVGLVASMPLLPPWDTDVMRIYAATIPLIAFTVAVGVFATTSAIHAKGSSIGLQSFGFQGDAFRVAGDTTRFRPPLPDKTLLCATVVLCGVLPPLLRLRTLPPVSTLEWAYAQCRSEANYTYLPHAALFLVSDSTLPGVRGLRLADFRKGIGDFAALYPGEAALLTALPADCALLPRDGRFSFIAIDAAHIPRTDGSHGAIAGFQFLAQGHLLIAADEALLARSAALAAYHPSKIGPFALANNRYPIIRAADTVTYAESITSIDFPSTFGGRRGTNPNLPIVVDIHRVNFPFPGEYLIRLNGRDTLKILVLDRDSREAESDRMIGAFVAANCAVEPDGVSGTGGAASSDVERLFLSETPARMSSASLRQLIALLQSTFNRTRPP